MAFVSNDTQQMSLADCTFNLTDRERKFLKLSWKAVNRAKQLRFMKTDEFKEYAHFRNGVEALPSLLRRKYHVDKIPAHGQKRTRLYFGFKIAALNFQKLLDYENSLVHYSIVLSFQGTSKRQLLDMPFDTLIFIGKSDY